MEFADAAVGADDEGEREGIPVPVGVGRLVQHANRMKGAPGVAIIDRDVGAIGANGDPGFALRVVGDRGAVAVRRGLGRVPGLAAVTS